MKPKTHKATAKRLKITAKKKILRRYTHQDHFNARERGAKTRSKRRNQEISPVERKKIKKLLPYSF
ncbi:MAG: 50S ribosomal protein L35 [Patescibacteria group bacterium]|nr:50S ribosomal protein L35 [Patescibacteria group bacterium]